MLYVCVDGLVGWLVVVINGRVSSVLFLSLCVIIWWMRGLSENNTFAVVIMWEDHVCSAKDMLPSKQV